MKMPSIVTSSLFFLGVLAFVAGTSVEVDAARPQSGGGEKCDSDDIKISQGSNISPYHPHRVKITNMCTRCSISDIQINCGSFLVDVPSLFKPLDLFNPPGVCFVVSSDKPLLPGRTVSFAPFPTKLPYTLTVASAVFHC